MTRIKCAVLRNLCKLEAAPSIEFKQPAGGSIDTEALLHKRPPREDDDAMERMHRRCGEMEERGFFMDLGNGSSTWSRTIVAPTTMRIGQSR